MNQLLYIDLFCGAGGTSTGVERARLGGKKCARVYIGNAVECHMSQAICEALANELNR